MTEGNQLQLGYESFLKVVTDDASVRQDSLRHERMSEA